MFLGNVVKIFADIQKKSLTQADFFVFHHIKHEGFKPRVFFSMQYKL